MNDIEKTHNTLLEILCEEREERNYYKRLFMNVCEQKNELVKQVEELNKVADRLRTQLEEANTCT